MSGGYPPNGQGYGYAPSAPPSSQTPYGHVSSPYAATPSPSAPYAAPSTPYATKPQKENKPYGSTQPYYGSGQPYYGSAPPPQPYGSAPPPQPYGSAPPQPYGSAPPPQPYGSAPPPQPYGSAPPPQPYGSAPPQSYGSAQPPQSYGLAQPPQSYGSAPPPQSYGSAPPPQPYGLAPAAQQYGAFPGLAAAAFPPGTDPSIVTCFQMADQDGSGMIDDYELQRALSSYNESFSMRTVHLLMHSFTNSNARKIGPKEFTALFYGLQNWRSIFERFDKDRSGKIDVGELREALLSLGFSVSPAVLDLLVSKFDKTGGRSRAIEYDNFIECCLTVKGLTEKFKEKDTSYSGSATFTYESFMLTVLPFLIA